MPDHFDALYANLRPEVTAYLCRLVIRPQIAEDLAQTAFQRLIEAGPKAPRDEPSQRAWIFKVATNLAIDELRRHSTWRETMVADLRAVAESSPAFVSQSVEMIGTPETKSIAREHLAACVACTLRNLSPERAAALLLAEVHGFNTAETADALEASGTQVKNWLQDARRYMRERYGATCALLGKQGVCNQCVELADFFKSGEVNPLADAPDHVKARMKIMSELRNRVTGQWHRHLFDLIDDIE